MTNKERVRAILHYENYDHMPVVAFGYWQETLDKWHREGHIPEELTHGIWDNSPNDRKVMEMLGFDFNWSTSYGPDMSLRPRFEEKILEEFPDGSRLMRDASGLIVRANPNITSIPAEVGTTFQDRESYETLYKPRLQYTPDRVDFDALKCALEDPADIPKGLFCGSLIGFYRDMLGVTELSYLYADDPDLFAEFAQRIADVCYQAVKAVLDSGATFDFAHFWEDICFKNGPLVSPSVFEEIICPGYKRITDLLARHGVDIVSLDCDGCIDALVPYWLENGVNTMFPIEVGTWNASIAPWREKYGRQIRGVGGMNKNVFARDYAAVDAEIERLKPLIELGGFIPCPDHRIPPDAKWENVQYYCDRMHQLF